MIFTGCSSTDRQEAVVTGTYTVSKSDVFLSTETSGFIGRPTSIKAYSGGLYIVDNGFQKIYKTDRKGDTLLSVGRHGRGPGEFVSPSGFWVFENNYLVYDYNGFKFITYDTLGNLVSERVVRKNPVNPDGFPPNIPITVHAISPHKLLIPSRGRNGSLFAIADIKTGELRFAGKAVGKHVKSYNSNEVDKALANGEIPGIFLNFIALGGSSSGIYSFQQTTGVLEKYAHSGDLFWTKSLKIPAQKDLFDRIAEKNRQADKNDESTQLFIYARAVDANEKGVAVLLNMPEGDPATVAWIPDAGNRLEVVVFPGLDQEKIGFQGSFSVSPRDKRAYFLDRREGIIFEAEWPL